MPERDYSRTQIYKLAPKDSDDPTLCYVGHSTDLVDRRSQHKSLSTSDADSKYYAVHRAIRDNGGWEAWEMTVIEEYSCTDKRAAREREQYHIDAIGARLNMVRAHATPEQIRESKRKHNKSVFERERQTARKADRTDCECGTSVRTSDLARHVSSKRHQEWANPELCRPAASTEPVVCACGGRFTPNNRRIHEATQRHQAYERGRVDGARASF